MMNSSASFLVVLALFFALSLHNTNAFSLSPKQLPAFIVGRGGGDRGRQQSTMTKRVTTTQGEALAAEEGKQSLDAFNALCQQVIAEERQQRYNQLLADCSSRSF